MPVAERIGKNRIIENTLGTGSTQMLSGVIISRPFASIEKLTFDRKRDAISFYTSSGNQMVALPSYQVFDSLPYARSTIGNTDYTITSSGNVMTESGTMIGRAILPQLVDRTIVMHSGSEIVSITPSGVHRIAGQYSNIVDIIATRT